MIIGIFGRKGTGKTVLANNQIKALNSNDILINNPYAENAPLSISEVDITKIKGGKTPLEVNFNQEEFDAILSGIKKFNGKKITVLIDDVNKIYTKNATDSVDWFIRASRTYENHLLFTTHRPYDVPRLFTANADLLCIFYTTEIRDLNFFDTMIPNISKEILKLKKYHYLEYDLNKQTSIIKGNKSKQLF